MTVVGRLQLAGCGMHLADQVALVCVPLAASLVFGASAKIIGVLVACQSMAHLLGSLPFGLIVDRAELRPVTVTSVLISLSGFCGSTASLWLGNLFWFGVSVTFSGFGVVLFVLAALSILPKALPAGSLAQANARIEIPRAVASFAVPLIVGVVITSATAGWIFAVAAVAAATALAFVLGLPDFRAESRSERGLVRDVIDGGAFVIGNDLLLAISLCALFWNFAFAALLVAMVPLIIDVYRIAPGTFGGAMSAFGLAAIAGSWLAARFADRIPPNIILVSGPASSVLAIVALYLMPTSGPEAGIHAAFFLLGFGPSMWLIVQNSVRQIVSPSRMLGRVNAVIQTSIYGIRPLGALVGGAFVSATSPRTGLLLIIGLYTLSFAAAALSRLRTIRDYADLRMPPGTRS